MMTTTEVNQLKEQVRSLDKKGELNAALGLVKMSMGDQAVDDYLNDNEFVSVERLIVSLEDELKDEADGLDEVNTDVGDIEPLAVKLSDIDSDDALIYDTSVGMLDATPLDINDVLDMIDGLSDKG